MHTAVFSIVSPNYRHCARVLMASVQRYHPDWDRFVLFVGETAGGNHQGEPFTAVPLELLPLPNRRQFCFRYTILELNTAVKPWMFEHLFARGYDRVVYLDPDTLVFSPLAELDALPAETFLTLTPHLTGSISGDEHPSERTILQAGTYNLGFLAVSRHPALARFLAWWQEKLEFQCVVDVERGLFVDQKWMDLAPGLFPDVAILRHEGYNVAYWNLRQRSVTKDEGDAHAVAVNGQPLRFFHFSGFDPAFPALVSRHEHGLKVADVGGAARLFEDYGVALVAAGAASFRDASYAFNLFADGTRVPDVARFEYRNSASLQAAGGADPFQHPELFHGLRNRSHRSSRVAKIGLQSYRLLSLVRPLVSLVPRNLRRSMREFLLGRRESVPRTEAEKTALPSGLNVIGYESRDTGVGESARLCLRACERVALPSRIIDVEGRSQEAVYRASIYHVNADRTLDVHDQLRQVFDASSYNIGCWHWELPELPDAWISSAEPLDEIWAASSFIQSAVSRKVSIPVVHMPHGIEVTGIEACSPEEFGVPLGRFTFLCMFDLGSVPERKNPLGAVEAFRRAAGAGSHAALLVKAGYAAENPVEYAELEEQLRGIPNVYLTGRMLSRARVNGLLAGCDSVVSLHRSEGFGLILAEAMSLGKPVVATGWSGNMDFMNVTNSCPVGYELVTLDRSYGAYEAGQQWAEPDLDHAAHLMRRLVEDSALRAELGENGRNTIREHFSPEAAGLRYRKRLEFLRLA